jgi:hypothetical protein
MYTDDDEQLPIIEVDYARRNPRKSARLQLNVLARCIHQHNGRSVRMVRARTLKKYGMSSKMLRNYCIRNGILHEVHVEMVEGRDGNETPRPVLYVDEVGLEESMRSAPVAQAPPDGWLSLVEIVERWHKIGMYTNLATLRTFCKRQVVQDAQIACQGALPSQKGRHKVGWYAEPVKLLELWEKECADG